MNPAIPDSQGMPDALAPQDAREILVVSARRIVAPNSKDNVYVSQGIQPRRIVLVLDEVARIIEINIIVRVAIRKILDVVVTA